MSDILQHLPEFFRNHPLLCGAFVALLIAVVGTEVARLFRGFKEVTPAGLTQLINRENALVIDLSPPADTSPAPRTSRWRSSTPSTRIWSR